MPLYTNQRHAWKKFYTMSGLVLLSLSLGIAREQIAQADADNSNQNLNQSQMATVTPVSSVAQNETLGNSATSNNDTDNQQQSQEQSVIDKQSTTNNQQQDSLAQPSTNKSTNTLTVNNTNQPTNNQSNAAIYSASFAAKSSLGTDIFNIGDGNYPRVDTVDVSSWQSWMTQDDFNRLKQLGVKTIIVKLTDGTTYVNPAAQNQIKFAQNAGLMIAVYHYAEFNNQDVARNEANYFADNIQKYGFGSGVAAIADMESDPVKRNNVLNDLNTFWSTLSQRGFNRHVVYTYLNLADCKK